MPEFQARSPAGACKRQPIHVTLTHQYFSLSLSPPPLSKNKQIKYLKNRVANSSLSESFCWLQLPTKKNQRTSVSVGIDCFDIAGKQSTKHQDFIYDSSDP